jgi:hypothetical protein
MYSGPTYRSILIVDTEGSGARTDPEKVVLRRALYRLLMVAFARAGLVWDHCVREDRGDGVYVLIPPSVPKPTLVTAFVEALDGLLGEPAELGPAGHCPRLRVSLHAGDVSFDRNGSSGVEVDHAFAIVDADPVRAALRAAERGRLVLVLSATFFDATVRQRYHGLDPAAYREVMLPTKRGALPAWVRVPGYDPPLVAT